MTQSEQLAAIRQALKAYRKGGPIDPVLKDAGLAPDARDISHDDAVQWLLKARAEADKAHIVRMFLEGVENNRAELRAALSALASATHFPDHPFTVTNQYNCQVCSAFDPLEVDFVKLNRIRYQCGSVLSGDIAQIAYFLQQAAATEASPPATLPLLSSIFQMIRELPDNARPKDLLKSLRKLKGVKMTDEEARSFIELLGHCGILQTPEHPGLLQRFTNQGLSPSSSRSSDWSYPVDFWRGEYGMNSKAMTYWFGEYPELLAQ
ncbi:hypothetical protein IAE35_15815 [Pseudomonas sp. S75]|uniref:hypothetical protein n=1 Tax=unclassified Pseudomonas TaxID=196821 RepID=UPI001905E043|nr:MULTISPECIES: hypothetical protein [unclassified Pseudomonas]MBJ9977377.1 hypothetical protein [Pseudomonas sp. S30]MBK0154811.1 hypothetical protein [Pseudomonas sp. S75]